MVGSSRSDQPSGKGYHRWPRVVLKLSGEAFSGDEALGISPDVVFHIAKEIAAAVAEGV